MIAAPSATTRAVTTTSSDRRSRVGNCRSGRDCVVTTQVLRTVSAVRPCQVR